MLHRQESNSEETSLVTKSAGSSFFPKTLSLVGFLNYILKIKAICKLCLWIFANIFHQHNLHNCRTWSKCVNFSQLEKGLHAGLNPNIISRRAIRWSFPLPVFTFLRFWIRNCLQSSLWIFVKLHKKYMCEFF